MLPELTLEPVRVNNDGSSVYTVKVDETRYAVGIAPSAIGGYETWFVELNEGETDPFSGELITWMSTVTAIADDGRACQILLGTSSSSEALRSVITRIVESEV